jgi:hypothetical protein
MFVLRPQKAPRTERAHFTQAANTEPAHAPATGAQGGALPLYLQAAGGEKGAAHTPVSPLVHDAADSSGQPLAASERAYFAGRMGRDFAGVRIHTGESAARSASALHANAYTMGRDIVFGAGNFQPSTHTGRRLLAHELTHVAQQQAAPASAVRGLGAAGDAYERQAGAVAEGLARGDSVAHLPAVAGGASCPALQRDTPPGAGTGSGSGQQRTAPPSQPLDYDRDPKNVAPVPAGQTAAGVTKLLQQKVKDGHITGFAVRGVPASSQPELFLLALLYGMAARARWGSEADIVTAIGWPPKAGAPAPQGRVTVRIDHGGRATAELIATGAVPTVAQTTTAAGSATLTADFGFAVVKGWAGQNPAQDAAEISDVIAALQLLKSKAPQDVAALRGVELIRVPALPNNRAGEFFAGSQVALGAAADVEPYLKLADRAFSSNAVQFAGGGPGAPTVPASFQVILHEVGHAVENEPLRRARAGVVTATADLEAARKLTQGDPAAFDAELKAAQRKGKRAVNEFYKKQAETYKRNTEAQEQADARLQTAKTGLDAVRDPGSGRTLRLQKFVALVTRHNIRRFTRYSAQHWPQNPEEFYAEAYSLWLVDPAFLQTNYRVVYEFFQNGDYLR